jgi:hypothetical protein
MFNLVIAALVTAGLVALLIAASRRGRLFITATTLVLSVAVAWILAAAAVRTDYRDADGFVDCWPSCSAFQDGVAITLFFGPPMAVLVVVASAILVPLERRRKRRAGGTRSS